MISSHTKSYRLLKQAALLTVLLGLMLVPHYLLALESSAKPISSLKMMAKMAIDGSVEIDQELIQPTPQKLDWSIFGTSHNFTLYSDNNFKLSGNDFQVKTRGNHRVIKTDIESRIWRISYTSSSNLIRHDQSNQIFIKVLENSGYVISEMRVTFQLPTQTSQSGLHGNVYAIQGAYNARSVVTKPNEIAYVANLVGPAAIFTVSAAWPKTIFQLNNIQEIRLAFINAEIIPWLILGLILPLISLLILLRLRLRQKKFEQSVTAVTEKLPTLTSPMLIGVLVDKKIYPREIAAMLIDLCQRGYLVIVKKAGTYYLGRRKSFKEGLTSWEKELLEEIFPVTNSKTTAEDLETISKQALFSPKVRSSFKEIYDTLTQLQLFKESPHFTRIKYKLFALLLHFISFIGCIWVAVFSVSPYLLIPLAGTMLIAFLIIRLTPQLANYTKQGLESRFSWVSFGNYLSNDQPIPFEALQEQTYEKYLSYAIALSKVEEWSDRFKKSSVTILKPDWFISYEEKDVESFTEEILEFTRSISNSLSEMKGPLVG